MQEMQETQVQSLGLEGPLEDGMATQYSCLENAMDRGSWQAVVNRVTELDVTEVTEYSYTHSLAQWPILFTRRPCWEPFHPFEFPVGPQSCCNSFEQRKNGE